MSNFLRVVGAPVLVLSIGDLATLCPEHYVEVHHQGTIRKICDQEDRGI